MTTETNTRSATGQIEVKVSPERVWEALTNSIELERWFPLEARVEPGEGGSIYMSWKNEYAGDSEILAWEPTRRLVISWGWDDSGEHPPQVTEYRLEGHGNRTTVKVVTSGFPADPSWDAFVEGTNRGWRFELRSLKEYLERHAGEDRDVVYVRRRIAMDGDEAWRRLFDAGRAAGLPLDGEAFDRAEPTQFAAVIDDFDGGLFRASIEPCMGDENARDVTLWLQAWGEAGQRLPEVEAKWRPLLEELFPEGRTL